MSLQFSLKEHNYEATYYPDIVFNKDGGASLLRIDSITSGVVSLGDGYCFIVVPRTWLDGKYIRWTWNGYVSGITNRITANALIYDGTYDRTSGTDFPEHSALATKGTGLLQTLYAEAATYGTWGPVTRDILVNVSGGSETYCTIFFKMMDHWTANTVWQDIDWVEINTSSGGSGNLYSEDFTDSVVMEVTGTHGDYGYISTGSVSAGEENTFYTDYLKF